MSIGIRTTSKQNPRILIVTPEITYLPQGMGNMANKMNAKAGGLADVSASLVSALFELGADVHVALPHYRRMFHIDAGKLISQELRLYQSKLPNDRIHLAEDRCFYYRSAIYGNYNVENTTVALAFQREVINNIITRVNPDLIHCNDWMTGLIPAAARRLNIPCLFTIHNIHTQDVTLADIEDRGIDAAEFWRYLYYKWPPGSYEETRNTTPVDMLVSGVFASHFINTVSPTFLKEIAEGQHRFVPGNLRHEIVQKLDSNCASGILNAPDAMFDPSNDEYIEVNYTADSHTAGKRKNKQELQAHLNLEPNPDAPIFFWPSRLDPIQKGPQLLADILYRVISKYWDQGLQVAIIANGAYQGVFHEIARYHDLYSRIAVCDFTEPLSHLGYAASDFMLMPSLFEPCGLPQMVSSIYGSLPIVHNTGGLHDTVTHLDCNLHQGNGFVFDTYDCNGLQWAIDEAMAFYKSPIAERELEIARIMRESNSEFSHAQTAQRYFEIYEKMLKRPLIRNY